MPLSIDTALLQSAHHQGSAPVVSPIVLSTNFLRDTEGHFTQDIYTRASNPNRRELEHKLSLLENAAHALAFSSGQAATLAIFQLISANSHVILPSDIYYGTKVLLGEVFAKWGITFSAVDITDLNALKSSFQENTSLVWIETPSNPQLKIADIQAIANLCKKNGILCVADNTWATPYLTQPLSLGVDVVMHSSTKYLGGHSDILGGALILNDGVLYEKLKKHQALGGGVPSPFDCWLLNRSLATFTLRMEKHCSNAALLASFLDQHPAVDQVYFPGLNPTELVQSQMQGRFGGMISIILKGDEENALKVAAKLKVVKNATSLGGVESLIDHRKSAEGEHSVAPSTLLRISVGIENIQDLIEDFNQALSK